MPAIHPSRLNAQVEELTGHFDSPKKFVSALHYLLDFYADRTRRPGQVIDSAPLLHGHQVAAPVLRRIERGLINKVGADPEAALVLADALWAERWVETRLLAISILGQVPPHPAERITGRAKAWGAACKEDKIIEALASMGLERLRREARDELIELIENWLASAERPQVLIGLKALPSLVGIEDFGNLPLVFRWIGPLVRKADREIRDDLAIVLRLLAKRSPRETIYFLRQSLAASDSPHTIKLIRRVSNDLPKELSSTLRLELRQRVDGET
ncbi:MAG: DNA alkylation repair protein [Chloroflexi bacterium]|nr:DNA alkylation repair protein [Chloroflexota bacterium]